MKKIIFPLLLFVFCAGVHAQNLLPEKWKFRTGDDPAWATAGFDDSGWGEIIPGTGWEGQGYPDYDGFAWYRVIVSIPSGLQDVAKKYGGLSLQLGKIDDVDFTYFNGEFLSGMGQLPPEYITKWNADRNYIIPYKKILWDQPNTIAVRVFDLTGGGGLYGYPIQLAIRGLSDKLTLEPDFPRPDHILEGTTGAGLTMNLMNKSRDAITGDLSMKIFSDFGTEVASYHKNLELAAKETYPVQFSIPGMQPGFYKVFVSFIGELAYKQDIIGFGYEPEKIGSPPDPRPDFDDYWDRAKKELAAVDPQFKMIRIDSLCTKLRNVYLVEMRSLGNVLIRGWYSVPSAPGKYPAILHVQGYGSIMMPEYADDESDFIGFALNIRGHGNSRDDVNPGFPGFLFSGIEDKETYIYRGAYMDCIRAVDFLFSRPEVDTARVAVEGGSQGGALTFATAALDNERIMACVPAVPFLSDFPDYFRIASWPADEFLDFIEKDKKMAREEVYNVLSYIDIKNLAGWIKAPMLMGVGLVDDVCPPHINFAAYNQVKSEKLYIVYPYAGHGLPGDFQVQKMKFIREKFGMPADW